MKAEVRAEIRERLIGYRRSFLIGQSDMLMSGLMALGGIVLIDCAVGPGDNMLRMVLWLSSATTIGAYHSDVRSMSVWFVDAGQEQFNAMGQMFFRLHAFTHFGFFAVLSNAFAVHPYWTWWALIVAISNSMGAFSLGGALRLIRHSRDVWGKDLADRAYQFLRATFRQVALRAVLATGIGATALMLPAELSHFAKAAVALLALSNIVLDYVLLKGTERWMVYLSSQVEVGDRGV